MFAAQQSPRLDVAAPAVAPQDVSLRLLRMLLWVYVAMWIFEGAFRKWILPGLANPLLVVRDPVLLLIYVIALAKGVFPRNAFIGWTVFLGLVAIGVSFVSTDTPLWIALYGLRAGYVHLPLIFLIGVLWDIHDVTKIGKWILILGIPMAVLVLLQFRARDISWLNTGAGGAGGMIESAFGHIRPSGTFSFTNGLSGFTAMISAYFLYDLLEKNIFPRLLWLATAPVLIVLIILSGSRTAVGTVFLILSTMLLISVLQPRYVKSAVMLLVLAAVAVVALGSLTIFKEGFSVFSYRFGSATNVQTGFVGRFFRSLTEPFDVIKDSKLGGRGLGMGTNVAAGLLNGKRGFLIAEGDPARVLLESGPIVGCAYLALRLAIVIYLGSVSLVTVKRGGSTLPLLLFAGCFNDILQGQFSQPTELGYATIAGGLCLAANQVRRLSDPQEVPDGDETVEEEERPAPARGMGVLAFEYQSAQPTPAPPAAEPDPAPEGPPAARGRSILAERLHTRDPE